MKKLSIFAVSFVFLLVLFGFNDSFASAKEEDDFTLDEIQQMLLDYFEENDLDLTVGSDEFIEYLLLQQLENKDETLSEHPLYELIDYYMGEYLYQLDQHLGEDSEFFDDLLDMTIGELKKEIDLRNAAEEELEQEFEELEQSIFPFSTLSTYNRTKAAEYAKKYAKKRNPKYVDYNSNCTNFVSQAIYAGGKKETKPSSVKKGITETTKYWYNDDYYDCTGSNNCYTRSKVSTSWIRVKDFYTYWLNKGMNVTTSAKKNTIVNNAKVGDVIQFKNKSGWYHSVIVTKKANGTVYISSNTKDYYNEDFKDKSAVSFRVINIK